MASCFSLAVVVWLLKHPPAVQTPPWVLFGSSRSSSPEVWEVLMSFLAGLLLNGRLLLLCLASLYNSSLNPCFSCLFLLGLLLWLSSKNQSELRFSTNPVWNGAEKGGLTVTWGCGSWAGWRWTSVCPSWVLGSDSGCISKGWVGILP